MVDRIATANDLERVRSDFHNLLLGVEPGEWRLPTSGTRWTNEELLFHMVFGFMVVQRLLLLVRMFGRLPDRISRGFASLLNSSTPVFHQVNYRGSRAAARVFNRRRMEAKLDRVLNSLQRSLARTSDSTLESGMHFPVRWDPYFRDYMTLADVYRYPGQHYDHHRRQLTIHAAGPTPESLPER